MTTFSRTLDSLISLAFFCPSSTCRACSHPSEYFCSQRSTKILTIYLNLESPGFTSIFEKLRYF